LKYISNVSRKLAEYQPKTSSRISAEKYLTSHISAENCG